MYQYNDNFFSDGQKSSSLKITQIKHDLSKIISNQLSITDEETAFYKVLHCSNEQKWITPYIQITKQIKTNFDNLIIISMGGASLNPQALICLARKAHTKPNIHFLNNTDPIFFTELFSNLNLHKTACLVISNSGETLETIHLTNICIEQYNHAGITNYENNFFFIVGKSDNQLLHLAQNLKAYIFDHEDAISGRYAGLTNVSTFPGMIAGLDMNEFLAGANSVIKSFWQEKEESKPAKSAAMLMALNKPILVNLAYLHCFSPFLEWYCQIIAESLGKNNKGFTPLRGIGPNDQHSVLQLYLDGPQDKIFTMFYVKELPKLPISSELEDINSACFHATSQALMDRGLPVRTIILDDLSERSIGALIAHSMIEIILVGHLLKVNPFDQPGVELIKTHAKSLIK